MPKGQKNSSSLTKAATGGVAPYERDNSCFRTLKLSPDDWSFVQEELQSSGSSSESSDDYTNKHSDWTSSNTNSHHCSVERGRARRLNLFHGQPCAMCGMDLGLSPEVRRGPNGRNSLCNRCGLRFAKDQKSQSSLMTHQIKNRMSVANLLNSDMAPQAA